MEPLRWMLVAVALGLSSTAVAQERPSPEEDPEQVRFESTYDRWNVDRHEPNYWRAIGWDLGIVAIGTGWYWMEKDINSLDWDYPTPLQRINGEAVRFDDNRFVTNTLGHPAAGMGYYGMARISGLEAWEAVLAANLSSALWEWGLEWREQVSVNDQVFTPVGGIALGEVAYQLGEYLNSAPDGGRWPQQVAAATLGFPRWLHDRADGTGPPRDLPPDRLGFSSAFSHRFRLSYEAQGFEGEDGERHVAHGASASVRLISMPGFMQPGSHSVAFANGNFTELRFRVASTGRGVDDFDLRSRATLAGYWTQDVRESPRGPEGVGGMVGVSTAFRHTDRHVLGEVDQTGVAHVVGPSAELHLRSGELRARIGADTYADFTALRSLAFPAWNRDNGTQGIKSVLYKRGYYYGLGFSTHLRAEAEWHGVEAGGSVGYGRWSSIEGLDREQESVTRDVPMVDDELTYEVWMGYTFPSTPLSLRLGAGGETRRGEMAETDVSRSISVVRLAGGLSF